MRLDDLIHKTFELKWSCGFCNIFVAHLHDLFLLLHVVAPSILGFLMAVLRILRKFPVLCKKGMPETITGRHWDIELVLELNIVGILGVLFFLISEELGIQV